MRRIEAIAVTAKDAQGSVLAHANVQLLPEPGAPAETGPVPEGATIG